MRDTVLVTGGNSGIGFECARRLAREDLAVLIASRNQKLSADAVRRIQAESGNRDVRALPLDLGSFAAVRAFADTLAAAVTPEIQIEFWDERLTTTVAERAIREAGGRKKPRKGQVDAVAAAVILQGYLDARRARAVR